MGEVHLALTAGDQRPMGAQEVGAQQHVRLTGEAGRQAAPGLGISHVPPQIGKTNLRTPDHLVADREALELPDPGIDLSLALAGDAASGDDAGGLRRNTEPRSVRLGQHRIAGSGIELGAYPFAVDRDCQPDIRACLDRHLAGGLGRPIRERYALAIPGLINPHRVVRQIEFDVDLLEVVVAEKDGNVVAKTLLAGDQHFPVLADALADPELIDMNGFGVRLAPDSEGAIAWGLISGQAQSRRCGAPHETHVRPGVDEDADLLAVDRAVENGPVVFGSKRPLGDPRHLAFAGLGGGAAREGEPDRGRCGCKNAPLHRANAAREPHRQPPCLKGDSPSLYSCTPAVTTLTRSRSAGVRKEFQTSKMRTMRGSPLSFHASCSKVSSNTQARPSRHSRVSAPTRKPQEGGTTSAMCTMKRVFVTPV